MDETPPFEVLRQLLPSDASTDGDSKHPDFIELLDELETPESDAAILAAHLVQRAL